MWMTFFNMNCAQVYSDLFELSHNSIVFLVEMLLFYSPQWMFYIMSAAEHFIFLADY